MAEAQEKQAQEVAIDRMRAYEVGIAHLCKDAGIAYDDLAKKAAERAKQEPETLGLFKDATSETLGPKLVEAMVAAGEAQQAKTE